MLDHGYHATESDVAIARAVSPDVSFFRGCEMDVVSEGNGIRLVDHVVIVCDTPIEGMNLRKVSHADLPRIQEHLDDHMGFSFIAHPYRRHDGISFRQSNFRPDAVEIASPNIRGDGKRERIAKLAREWGMLMVACSDAHKPRNVGEFCIMTEQRCLYEGDLAMAVMKGSFVAMERKLSPVEIPRV